MNSAERTTEPNYEKLDDEDTYTLLREKIRSKMEVAKSFAGFVSVVLGITAKDVLTRMV